MSNGNTYFNRFNTPIVFEHLFDIFSVCFLHIRLVSINRPYGPVNVSVDVMSQSVY